MRFNTFADVAAAIVALLAKAIPVVFLLCFAAFFWNGGRYILGGSDSKDAGERKNWLIYGIVGLLAAITLGGFVYLLQNFFFTRNAAGITALPCYSKDIA